MKNSKQKLTTPLLVFIGVAALMGSCKKDDDSSGTSGGQGYMQMEMTDTPGNYMNVYVDIKSVEVHQADTGSMSGWVTLNTRDTIYDLLTLQNDLTAVLADSTLLPAGKITQMRLILGTENSVVLNDLTVHPLTIPSSMQTGIKINLNTTIEANKTTRVLIDFNADSSINLKGNDEYQMSPVISVKHVHIN